jgi:hypothetical protein
MIASADAQPVTSRRRPSATSRGGLPRRRSTSPATREVRHRTHPNVSVPSSPGSGRMERASGYTCFTQSVTSCAKNSRAPSSVQRSRRTRRSITHHLGSGYVRLRACVQEGGARRSRSGRPSPQPSPRFAGRRHQGRECRAREGLHRGRLRGAYDRLGLHDGRGGAPRLRRTNAPAAGGRRVAMRGTPAPRHPGRTKLACRRTRTDPSLRSAATSRMRQAPVV